MEYYYVFLSFHLISIIVWISCLVYLSRLVLIQVENKNSNLQKEAFFISKKISTPAFLSTVTFGLILIVLNKGILETGFWIYIKFFLISLVIMVHHLISIFLNQIEENRLLKSKRYLNIFSFSPLILVFFIVLLTINKPF